MPLCPCQGLKYSTHLTQTIPILTDHQSRCMLYRMEEKKLYHYTKQTGRPTKYLVSVINPKIVEYLQQCSREQTKLPTIEGLANYLNVNPDTIYEWTQQHPEFSENIKRLASAQKDQLINDGMYGGREINANDFRERRSEYWFGTMFSDRVFLGKY